MSMVASAGFSVARAQNKCVACGREFVIGEKLQAALRETAAGLERLDICPTCWPGFDKTALLGYWQTIMPAAAARRKVFVDDTVLCELFERLSDAAEPAKVNFRFVLGLILMQKRRLVYEGTKTEPDREIWTVRFRGREGSLDLLNPRITEQQIAEVSTQLSEILDGEL